MPKRRRRQKIKIAIVPLIITLACVGAIGFVVATVVSQAPLFAYRAEFPDLDEKNVVPPPGHEEIGLVDGADEAEGAEETVDEGSDDEVESEEVEDVGFDYDDVTHVETPDAVKALYMTSCAIGTPSLRNHVFDLVDSTEINSVIIDIKDYTGTLSFKPRDPELVSLYENAGCGSPYMGEIISELHEKGVYVIGRITVFQDPYYANKYPEAAVKRASDGAVWTDHKGLNFTDPGAKQVWDHTVAISRESYEIGFDELNFDYVRYPSDGPMSDIAFPQSGDRAKVDVLEDFFVYLDETLEEEAPGVVTSADLFGMTTTATDGLNIGQILERTLPHFDYVAPMVYPSHYPSGFEGYTNPNTVPYEIVHIAMSSGVEKAKAADLDWTKLRSWIQDFDYGGNYGAAEVRAQIQATYDAGLDSWMVWDPSNKYTRDALEAE